MTVFTSQWPRKFRNSLPSVRGPTGGWDWPVDSTEAAWEVLFSCLWWARMPAWETMSFCDADEGSSLYWVVSHLPPKPPFCSQTPESSGLRRLLPCLCPALTSYLETELLPPVWKRSGKACSSKVENCPGTVTSSMTDPKCWWRGKAGVRERDMKHREGRK